jgi:molybdopterin-guanine dinucleotide biosynthesis protein A
MAAQFPGAILSGGKSSRMGASKALLPFGAARLVDHVAARFAPQVSSVLLNANDEAITLENTPRFPDRFEGFAGPLAGLHAALAETRERYSTATHVAIITVDTPFFPLDMYDRLARALTGPDDFALAASDDRLHPVSGLWPIAVLQDLARWLAKPPTLKVRAFLDNRSVKRVDFAPVRTAHGDIDPFFNINTPDDLAAALGHLGQA